MASNRSVAGDLVKGLEGAIEASPTLSSGSVSSSPFYLESPVPPSPKRNVSASSASKGKRKRLSMDPTSDENITMLVSGPPSSATVTKLAALVDETKLENERLRDKLKSFQDEQRREIERAVKQVEFIEDENSRLRKSNEELREKYYEGKKKLIDSKREMTKKLEEKENEIQKSSRKFGFLPEDDTPDVIISGSLNAASTSTAPDEVWRRSAAKLEASVKSKSAEIKQLAQRVAELEERNQILESQLLKTSTPSSSSPAEDADEMRELRKRSSDLEIQLRRVTRDNEKNVQRVQNQNMLEKEITTLKSQLKVSEATVAELQKKENTITKLQCEKDEWTALFKDVLQDAASLTDTKAKFQSEFTPISALQLLSSAQNRCAVMLRSQSDLESNLQDMRNKFTTSESKRQQLDQEISDCKHSMEKCENKLHLSRQQTRLFEKEVKSLRALLKSYDSEFKIGKPKVDDVIASKDRTIEEMRTQLDECRQEVKSLADKLEEKEDATQGLRERHSSESDTMFVGEKPANDAAIMQSQRDEISLLKHQLQRLRDELFGLQKATGQDHVPSQTRVLHFIKNPVTLEAASKGKTLPPATQKFKTALEEVRHLREENRRLQNLVIESTDDGCKGRSSSNSSNLSSSSGNANESQKENAMETSVGGSIADANNTSILGPDSNKMNQRLKEMFKERITCFREAVYLLTGFKIDLYSADANNGGHPRLRLRSMYAEDPDDSLLFQWRGNNLELIETPFAGKLDPRLFSMLQVSNSVPAFLCNVTLELFENQTFMG